MRTNIVLDDELLRKAAEIAGTKTKKSTVEYALKELIRQKAMEDLLDWRMDIDPDDVRPGIEPSRGTKAESA
jgi:Arc/MetJ family transcription regulator